MRITDNFHILSYSRHPLIVKFGGICYDYTMTENQCIFCRIVGGKLPSYTVYEDKLFLGFLDIHPRTKGHTLLIPKAHCRWTYDVPEFGLYWEAALKITKAMQKVFNPSFVTYVTHGLEVPHAHIHILPRYNETEFVPDIKKFTEEEMKNVRNLLVNGLKG